MMSDVRSFRDKSRRLLKVFGSMPHMFQAPLISMISKKKVIAGPASGGQEDLCFLIELAEREECRPFIDRRYPFEQIPKAHRHVDPGRKRGNVMISQEPPKNESNAA